MERERLLIAVARRKRANKISILLLNLQLISAKKRKKII